MRTPYRQRNGNLQTPASIWWLNPAVAFSAPCLLAGLAAYVTAPTQYLDFWRTVKYFDWPSFELLMAIVTVFVCGSVLGAARRRPAATAATADGEDWKSAIRWPAVRFFFRLSFALTMIAYAIWIMVALKNGLNVAVILSLFHGVGDATEIRVEYLTTIPGVTTATQFGIAAVALAVPLAEAKGWRTLRWQCALIFLMAFLRVFLNSERLAIIELMVPFVVSFLWLRPATKKLFRIITQTAPFLAAACLYVLFGAGEYFRSWSTFYAARHESSFWSFLALRLMGYYTTALNNGALLWKMSSPLSLHLSLTSLDFLWRFPLFKSVFVFLFPSLSQLAGVNSELVYSNLLTATANLEFNNPSGVFIPIVDYGIAGGLLYWLLSGLLCGFLYQEFKQRSVAGVFLYPVLYISLIEASRILYWADGRFLPGMCLLLIGVLFVFKKSAKINLARPAFTRAAPTYRL